MSSPQDDGENSNADSLAFFRPESLDKLYDQRALRGNPQPGHTEDVSALAESQCLWDGDGKMGRDDAEVRAVKAASTSQQHDANQRQ